MDVSYDRDYLSILRNFLGNSFYFWKVFMERETLLMSDAEFDVLDQLYFVTRLDHILEELDIQPKVLIQTLTELYKKGWIKILETVDDDVSVDKIDLENNAGNYFYLATKEGLLAHNS